MGKASQATLEEVLEVVEFIRDNAVSKQDLAVALAKTENRIMTHIDAIVTMHTKLDEEQIAIRALYHRHEAQLGKIAKHVNINLE